MKIIAISDIHGKVDFVHNIAASIKEADLVIISGDITDFQGYGEAKYILETIGCYNKNIIAVGGNCDLPGVCDYLAEQNFHPKSNCIIKDGLAFICISGSYPEDGFLPGEGLDEHFARIISRLDGQVPQDMQCVLISHQPASDTKLDTRGAGSKELRKFIDTHQPVLTLSGHFHESAGIDKIGPTTLVNPGPLCQGSYATIEIVGNTVTNVEIQSI
jgi:Icc-related predicted phosphoesterase